MSSKDSDEDVPPTNMFLPSMLRKNGSKFGASLGNALMNKFQPPRISSQPDTQQNTVVEAVVPIEESKMTNSEITTTTADNTTSKFGSKETLFLKNKVLETRPTTFNFSKEPVAAPALRLDLNKSSSTSTEILTNTSQNEKTNPLDQVERHELLKDVRSQRVKSPSTRPKSTNIFKDQIIAAEISLDKDSNNTPIDSPAPPLIEEKKTLDNPALAKIVSAQSQAEAVRSQYSWRNRSERPLSVGNVEAFRRLSPENLKEDKSIHEGDKDKGRNKVLAKGLHHSKSTEILSSDYAISKDSVSSTEKASKPVDKLALRGFKNAALALAKSIKSMEAEIATMKTQLSNLVTLIGETERGDKK